MNHDERSTTSTSTIVTEQRPSPGKHPSNEQRLQKLEADDNTIINLLTRLKERIDRHKVRLDSQFQEGQQAFAQKQSLLQQQLDEAIRNFHRSEAVISDLQQQLQALKQEQQQNRHRSQQQRNELQEQQQRAQQQLEQQNNTLRQLEEETKTTAERLHHHQRDTDRLESAFEQDLRQLRESGTTVHWIQGTLFALAITGAAILLYQSGERTERPAVPAPAMTLTETATLQPNPMQEEKIIEMIDESGQFADRAVVDDLLQRLEDRATRKELAQLQKSLGEKSGGEEIARLRQKIGSDNQQQQQLQKEILSRIDELERHNHELKLRLEKLGALTPPLTPEPIVTLHRDLNPAAVAIEEERKTENSGATDKEHTPAVDLSSTPQLNDQPWILAQPRDHFTIQLLNCQKSIALGKFITDNGDPPDRLATYHAESQGELRHILIMGSYPSVAAAKKVLKTLPKSYQKHQPWIKKFAGIQKLLSA
ncbi:MAG: hypothetical protein HQL48_03330 [Gammaproteobacteria bacterium]|nr:hypothetical protein [Gammaproteobacteria bacterium]